MDLVCEAKEEVMDKLQNNCPLHKIKLEQE
jgi:hypothetical protein